MTEVGNDGYVNHCPDEGVMPIGVKITRKERFGINMGVFVSTIERLAKKRAWQNARLAVREYDTTGIAPWSRYDDLQSFTLAEIVVEIPDELLPHDLSATVDFDWELSEYSGARTRHTISQWSNITGEIFHGAPSFVEAIQMWIEHDRSAR